VGSRVSQPVVGAGDDDCAVSPRALSFPSFSASLATASALYISGVGMFVLRDNVNMQHFQGLIDMIEGIGCEVVYLAPYDPRCNPIEAAFSQVRVNPSLLSSVSLARLSQLIPVSVCVPQVKRYMRKHGRSPFARRFRSGFIHCALRRVNATNAQGYFRKAGLLRSEEGENDSGEEEFVLAMVLAQMVL
jgi:hypothetical protein